MAIKLSKIGISKVNLKQVPVYGGNFKAAANKIKFNRIHALLVAAVSGIVGFLFLGGIFGASQFTVISPANGATVNSDFEIRTRFTADSDISSKLNIVVTLDGRVITSKVINEAGTFKVGQTYDYVFSGGVNGANLFPINTLRPGPHTLRSEVRFGETIGSGTLLNSYASSFTAQTTNLIAAGENPISINAAYLPKGGTVRLALDSQISTDKAFTSKLSSQAVGLLRGAGEKATSTLLPKASAHTGQHGHINSIVYVDDPYDGSTSNDRRQGGVTIRAKSQRLNTSNVGCHPDDSRNSGKDIFKNADNSWTIRGVSDNSSGTNHGEIHFYTCAVGNFDVSFDMPGGYHLHPASAQSKTIYVADNASPTVEFTIRPNDDDGDGTPNYRDACASQAGPNSNGGCPVTNVNPCQSPTPSIVNNVRTPLFRFWSEPWTDHAYQTTQMSENYLSPSIAYCYQGHEGYIYPNQVPGTVELSRYFRAEGGWNDNLYTVTRDDAWYVGQNAYVYKGPAGYVSPTQVTGTTPLYRSWSASRADHFYTTNSHEVNLYSGYVYEGVEGYVWVGAGSYTPPPPPAAVYNHNPADGPLVAVSSLGLTSAEVYAFGYRTANNLPTSYLSSVSLSIDGATPQIKTGQSSNPSHGPITFSFASLDDGKPHSLVFTATNQNGLSNSLTIAIAQRTAVAPTPTPSPDPAPSPPPDGTTDPVATDSSLGLVRYVGYINWSWPLGKSYPLTGCWNEPRSTHKHSGLDLGAGTGVTVKAAAKGKVVKATYEGGYGNHVIVYHNHGKYTLYGHMSKISKRVGDSVARGDKVGEVGNTGGDFPPHLHFNIQNTISTAAGPGRGAFNPINYLPHDGRPQLANNVITKRPIKCVEGSAGWEYR